MLYMYISNRRILWFWWFKSTQNFRWRSPFFINFFCIFFFSFDCFLFFFKDATAISWLPTRNGYITILASTKSNKTETTLKIKRERSPGSFRIAQLEMVVFNTRTTFKNTLKWIFLGHVVITNAHEALKKNASKY